HARAGVGWYSARRRGARLAGGDPERERRVRSVQRHPPEGQPRRHRRPRPAGAARHHLPTVPGGARAIARRTEGTPMIGDTPLRRIILHGHSVAYRTAGEGPVVVLVHGMAGSSDTWRYVLPALARRFTVVAPDLLGHGETAKPRAEYSVSAHANVLRDLMAALGHARATVVGHSLGGGIVMQLAYQFPERCDRLVLVSSGGLGREVSGLLRGLSVPGVEHVFPLVCFPALRDAARRVAGWIGDRFVRPSPVAEEIFRSWSALADDDTRRAFFRT